jgi:hypothetical protein
MEVELKDSKHTTYRNLNLHNRARAARLEKKL